MIQLEFLTERSRDHLLAVSGATSLFELCIREAEKYTTVAVSAKPSRIYTAKAIFGFEGGSGLRSVIDETPRQGQRLRRMPGPGTLYAERDQPFISFRGFA